VFYEPLPSTRTQLDLAQKGGADILTDILDEALASQFGQNITVTPSIGRMLMFTSGRENIHFVEPVSKGTRYALTIAFSCNPEHELDLEEFLSTRLPFLS